VKRISGANATNPSENGEGSVAGAAAEPNKTAQPKPEGLGALFRRAVKAVTGNGEDEALEAKRKRREDTEGGFAQLRMWFSRPYRHKPAAFRTAASNKTETPSRSFEIDADVYDHAEAFLSDTLSILNQWNDEDFLTADFDDGYIIDHNYSSLDI
jgi:hypothetical protein